MTRRILPWLVAASGLLATAPVTDATTVESLSLDEMIERASFIFIGKAGEARAEWNADHTRIYTYVRFDVERYLKGGAGGRELTLRVPGGQVGEFAALMPGAPQFTPGEDVLLFCSGAQARVPTVLGLALGKFAITRAASGERILKRDVSGLVLADYRTDSRTPDTPVTQYRLSEIEARIRRVLAP